MISLYIFLVIMLVVAAAAIVMLVFGQTKNKTLRSIVNWGIVVIVAIAIAFGIGAAITNGQLNDLQNEYDELMLYYYTVNTSTNEYVRYDYFDKVQDYNEQYNSKLEASQNAWFGWLLNEDWNANMGPVEFYLNGDPYGEG